jgi:uncharacterized protein YqgC (DUF456 family)
LLLLAGLVLASFAPLAERGRALVYRDLVVYTAPQDAVLREAVLERHELPRRNPYIYGGVANLADPSTETLYPPRLLAALAFAPPRSIHVFVLGHFLLAALGAAFFARALGASRAAATAAGAVYALSGPVLSLQENLPLLAGAAWLPWACALARRRSLLAALPVGFAALAGDIQGATWAALLVPVILIAGRGPLPRRATLAVATPVLGLLLASVLLVPALELRPDTDRVAQSAEDAGAWSLAPARLVELAVPFPFGVSFPDRASVTDGLEPEGSPIHEPWSETIHVGLVGLALGAGALLDRRRRKRAATLLALAALALAAAMGPRGPLVWKLLRLLPFYADYRHPEKHAVLFALAAAPLAALGVDAARRASALAAIPLAALGALGARWSLEGALLHSPHHAPATSIGLELARGVVLLGVAASISLPPRRGGRVGVGGRRWALALLVALDVLLATHPRVFVGDATLYDEHPLGVDLVRASGARVLRFPWKGGERLGYVPLPDDMPGRRFEERAIAERVRSWVGSVSARERVPALHGMASFTPRGIDDKLATAASLDALSVRFLVSDGHGDGAPVASEQGVFLLDRGRRIAPAPPPSFEGEVPCLGVGAALSAAALLVLSARLARRCRARRPRSAGPSPTG